MNSRVTCRYVGDAVSSTPAWKGHGQRDCLTTIFTVLVKVLVPILEGLTLLGGGEETTRLTRTIRNVWGIFAVRA